MKGRSFKENIILIKKRIAIWFLRPGLINVLYKLNGIIISVCTVIAIYEYEWKASFTSSRDFLKLDT